MTETTRKKLSIRQIWLILGLILVGLLVFNWLASNALRTRPDYGAGNQPNLASSAYAPSLPDLSSLVRLDAFSYADELPQETITQSQPVAALPQEEAQQSDRLIIRSGALTLVVDDTRAANQSIVQMVSELAQEGAFVVSSSERGGTGDKPPQISITLRVPAPRFTQVMDRLASMAVEVVDRTESGQDVTEEYVDVQAKIESLEVARQRLLDIVREAQNTEDLLAAEKVLTERENEIDSLKARLQYLAQSAQLSSISIELRPSILNQPVAPGWRPSETVRRAVERLAQRFQNFVDTMIIFAIADLPWWIGFALVVLVVARAGLWWLRRKNAPTQPAAAAKAEE